ncbi:hypothetical protein [Nocardioides bruguierae]|uniref:Uncharacterized protein n=1 Tax=Nocardioides bruguierae TaxID=2945102 RepID=A0A9X2IGA8_9ACTN|nr:hypothetical protein [Nocardioides bruguierae]MCM0622701.1 hypothetical protein [Nocardioides bruguierae]
MSILNFVRSAMENPVVHRLIWRPLAASRLPDQAYYSLLDRLTHNDGWRPLNSLSWREVAWAGREPLLPAPLTPCLREARAAANRAIGDRFLADGIPLPFTRSFGFGPFHLIYGRDGTLQNRLIVTRWYVDATVRGRFISVGAL